MCGGLLWGGRNRGKARRERASRGARITLSGEVLDKVEQFVIEAQIREVTGKCPNRRLRRSGLIPGVVYGHGADPVAIALPTRTLEAALHTEHGMNVLLDLRIPGFNRPRNLAARIRAVQRDRVRHVPVHVDFQWVSLGERITATVPIVVTGEAPGVLEGGVIDQTLHEVEVECLPTEIPEHLTVDITGLGIRDSRRVSDLQVPPGLRVLTPEEETVVTIAPPIGEEALEAQVEEAVREEEAPEAGAERGET